MLGGGVYLLTQLRFQLRLVREQILPDQAQYLLLLIIELLLQLQRRQISIALRHLQRFRPRRLRTQRAHPRRRSEHLGNMMRLIIQMVSMLLLLLQDLILRKIHTNRHGVCEGNVMLLILLRHLGNLLQFQINHHLISHLPIEIILEFMRHHHVHIIRRQCPLAELYSEFIIKNVPRQRGSFSLFSAFLLLQSLISVRRRHLAHLFQLALRFFFEFLLVVLRCQR